METRVEKSKLRQAQEVGAIWKNDRKGQRQLEEIRKPRALSPMRSHKGELRPPRFPEFRQDSGNDGKRRKGVSLQTIPVLEEGVRARRLRVSVRRKINRAAVIGGGRKQIDLYRP